jgi:hypothetical protein
MKGRAIFARTPLGWRETVRRFSYYSFGIAALWALAFALSLISGAAPR